MKYYNLQIIYNYTVISKEEEQEILALYEEAGKPLELLPHFELKEVRRQSQNAVADSLHSLLSPTS